MLFARFVVVSTLAVGGWGTVAAAPDFARATQATSVRAVAAVAEAGTPGASPEPSKSPAPPSLRSRTDPPLYVSASLAGYATAQAADAKILLPALEAAFARAVGMNHAGKRVVFYNANDDGGCGDDKRDSALLELTRARIVSIDDNYLVAEHFSQRVEISAVLRACDGTILAEEPVAATSTDGRQLAGASQGAWVVYSSSNTSLGLLSIIGLGSIANATNTDKTAAASLTFLSSFKDIKLPAYHKDDKLSFQVESAAIGVADTLLRRLPASAHLF